MKNIVSLDFTPPLGENGGRGDNGPRGGTRDKIR